MLTQEYLKSILSYDPLTGVLIWLVSRDNGAITAGSVAGGIAKSGYRTIQIDGKRYRAHRLIWLMMMGSLPEDQIDHIGPDKQMTPEEKFANRSDNRWCNLRLATHVQNLGNRGKNKNNQSGFKGVHLLSSGMHKGKYRAEISVNGKKRYLGYFNDPKVASDRYKQEADQRLGEFARAA